jgi:hypothetical protein
VALEDIMHEAEREVRTFAAANMAKQPRSGLPAPPKIEVEETTLESAQMDLKINRVQDRAEAFPGGGGGLPPPNRTGACCVGGVCSITSHAHCDTLGGIYMGDGTTCTPDPC